MDLFLFFIIIFVAATLQTSSGYGFSILATPFLLILFEPFEAIQINLVLSLFISLILIYKIKHDINFSILRKLIVGSFPGLPLGILFFYFTHITYLKLTIGIIILILTIFLILNFRITQSTRRDILVGSLSGAMTTSIGMPGPPLLLYFSGTDTKKESLRATTLAFYLFIYCVSLIIQMSVVGTSKIVWFSSGIALPIVLISLYLGQILFNHLSQRSFQVIVYLILFFTAIYLLIESFI